MRHSKPSLVFQGYEAISRVNHILKICHSFKKWRWLPVDYVSPTTSKIYIKNENELKMKLLVWGTFSSRKCNRFIFSMVTRKVLLLLNAKFMFCIEGKLGQHRRSYINIRCWCDRAKHFWNCWYTKVEITQKSPVQRNFPRKKRGLLFVHQRKEKENTVFLFL